MCSVSWSPDGAYLAVGNDNGEVEIWDVEENKRMRIMAGHNARVPSLSWNGHLLSSGCRDGTIFHHDVRVAQHKVAELRGHASEVSSELDRLIPGVRPEMAPRWPVAG